MYAKKRRCKIHPGWWHRIHWRGRARHPILTTIQWENAYAPDSRVEIQNDPTLRYRIIRRQVRTTHLTSKYRRLLLPNPHRPLRLFNRLFGRMRPTYHFRCQASIRRDYCIVCGAVPYNYSYIGISRLRDSDACEAGEAENYNNGTRGRIVYDTGPPRMRDGWGISAATGAERTARALHVMSWTRWLLALGARGMVPRRRGIYAMPSNTTLAA